MHLKRFAQSLGVVHCRSRRFEEKTKAGSRARPLTRLAAGTRRTDARTHVRCTAPVAFPRNRDGTGNELSVDYTNGQSYARKVITRWPPPPPSPLRVTPSNAILERAHGIS